jgi:hypothetical protein
MPTLQSLEAKVDTQPTCNLRIAKSLILLDALLIAPQGTMVLGGFSQSNVLRAPEPLANDQWEAKYGAKKVN